VEPLVGFISFPLQNVNGALWLVIFSHEQIISKILHAFPVKPFIMLPCAPHDRHILLDK